VQHQPRSGHHPQVRWRQQTLPAVYFENEPESPPAKEKSANPGSVKWSSSVQSSHGTSPHSSFDTLDGNRYVIEVRVARFGPWLTGKMHQINTNCTKLS
jgi:hypothetical protein